MDLIIRKVRIADDKPLVDIGIVKGRIDAIEEHICIWKRRCFIDGCRRALERWTKPSASLAY